MRGGSDSVWDVTPPPWRPAVWDVTTPPWRPLWDVTPPPWRPDWEQIASSSGRQYDWLADIHCR